MNWYETLERKRISIIFAVNLIAFATLLVSALRIFAGFDAYWQLQMGKDWVENGLSPWIDHYSFTFPGAEIVGPPVIFQVALYELVARLGEFGGFFTIRLGAFLLTLTMMLLWLRQIRAPVLAYCIVIPLLTFLMQLRGIVRPELLSYSLSILAIMLYQRTRMELSFRSMWPIVALMLFWTNLHASVIGYVIYFGLFVDIAVRLFQERAPLKSWSAWMGWGLVLLGVGFLTPGFNHPLQQYIQFSNEWKTLIQEYWPPTKYLGIPAIYILIPVVLSSVVLLAQQRKYGFLAVSLCFLYAGLTMARMVTPGGILFLCLFAYVLSASNPGIWLRNISSVTRKAVAALFLIAYLVPMLNGVHVARRFLTENQEPFNQRPHDLTEHMITNQMFGRIFNTYEIGGYLIYRLPRENPVYIDGRTGILYPTDLLKSQLEAEHDAGVFLAEVQKYGVDFAIFEASEAIAAVMATAGFQLDFVDYQYALYNRESGGLKNSGILWSNPSCWSPELATLLDEEWTQALIRLPANARIMPLLAAARDYRTSSSPDEFFAKAAKYEWFTDATRRFVGYRALDSGLFEIALNQFVAVAGKEPKDFLAVALALLRMGELEEAERTLDQATRVEWAHLEFQALLILHALLHEISQERPLELFESRYVNDLEAQVGSYSMPVRGEAVTVGAFCESAHNSTEHGDSS